MRKALGVAGALLVVLAIGYVVRPSGHVPLYDANLVRLAETEREGVCAGVVYWQTRGTGDAASAAECRDGRNSASSEVNPQAAQIGFCRGVAEEGYQGDLSTCLGILVNAQLWPTYDGSLSGSWNRTRPYPLDAVIESSGVESDSRTGVRQPTVRRVPVRGAAPAPAPTESPEPTPTPSTTPAATEDAGTDEEEDDA